MPLINANAIARCRRVAALAAAFAAAPLLLSAVSHAEPDPGIPAVDVKAQCESPDFGGVYVPTPATEGAAAHAVCQYIVSGQFYYDNFDNGLYTGTLVYKDGAKVPTERPQIPGLLDVPGGMPMVVFPGQF